MTHPDAVIEALEKELKAHPENSKGIEAEIKFYRDQPRPPEIQTLDNQLQAVVDQKEQYLAGLERELAMAPAERKREIQGEIDRVKKGKPSVERAVRSARGVQKSVVDNDLPEE
jgi:cell division protein FtsB